jgi:hypothetical protein
MPRQEGPLLLSIAAEDFVEWLREEMQKLD